MNLKEFFLLHKKNICIAGLILLACAALTVGIISYAKNTGENLTVKTPSDSEYGVGEIYVHVKGAVCTPGLYKLPRGSRVNDAVQAAGGTLEDADVERINLAKQVDDGQEVLIPSTLPKSEAEDDGRVNINTADVKTLSSLPGIGDAMADRIIEYRQQKGSFSSIDEILRVSGIGNSKFNDIKDQIKVYD